MSDTDDKGTRFECGCVIGNIGDSFIIQPCSETCDVYAYAIEESRKQQNGYREINTEELAKRQLASAIHLDVVFRCPYCATQMDAVTGEDGKRPTPGSVTICFYCARVSVFAEGLQLRKPTEEESKDIANDVELQLMRKAAQQAIRERLTEN